MLFLCYVEMEHKFEGGGGSHSCLIRASSVSRLYEYISHTPAFHLY